ncbi:N-acetyltransferase 9-like protein [Agrilus planipennis]|uniref:N-acetyltransferase 9-like protein n=1 Tax=Agrilus planipennis TaxID=224129 RepID=A0A1W4XEI6_AGRPL|nr:N-acetyltransferase 9-like protein [Agrilus planipennis]
MRHMSNKILNMHYNQHIRIIGEKVILVPYRRYHVAKYHKWMLSRELQNLTASEPLTLEEEYEMQKSWHEDNNKCTFIILDKKHFQNCDNEVESMVGDTNLFFLHEDSRITAEAEIMIAESKVRGSGFGWEAVVLMLLFGINYLGL